MREYRIYDRLIDVEAEASQPLLRKAHSQSQRPLCMCRHPGIPMYLATVSERVIVKRLPGSGVDHHPECESYEPPAEVSGISELQGRAIKENDEKGVVELRLDFPLKKSIGKAPPVSDGPGKHDSVRSDGGKLTMLGTLHYLWDQAGLNRWHPKMTNRRHWGLVRHLLREAATAKLAKGIDIKHLLYIPEPWNKDDEDALRSRRIAHFRDISHGSDRTKSALGLVIGEFKNISPTANTMRLSLKHAPDAAFLLPSDVHKKITKIFSSLLSLREADESIHIITMATVSLDGMLIPSIEQITFMATTAEWIPIDGPYDSLLVSALIHQGRSFLKGLRYNLSPDTPLASLVLTDTTPPTNCFVIDKFANDASKVSLARLMEGSSYPTWSWNLDDEELPPFPAPGTSATTVKAPVDPFQRKPYVPPTKPTDDSVTSGLSDLVDSLRSHAPTPAQPSKDAEVQGSPGEKDDSLQEPPKLGIF